MSFYILITRLFKFQAFEQQKRRSQGGAGDSKYGFSLPGQVGNPPAMPTQYPGGPPQPRSPHQGPPDLPPRVDRNAKPTTTQTPRGTLGRSAQERLINKTDSVLDMGNYINATPHRANTTSSLERPQPKSVRAIKFNNKIYISIFRVLIILIFLTISFLLNFRVATTACLPMIRIITPTGIQSTPCQA